MSFWFRKEGGDKSHPPSLFFFVISVTLVGSSLLACQSKEKQEQKQGIELKQEKDSIDLGTAPLAKQDEKELDENFGEFRRCAAEEFQKFRSNLAEDSALTRARLLMDASTTPVFWSGPDPYLGNFNSFPGPSDSQQFRQFWKKYRRIKTVTERKELMLQDGYAFYDGMTGRATMASVLSIADLSKASKLRLVRGFNSFEVERVKVWQGTDYVYIDGPQKGAHAELRFWDQLVEIEEPQEEAIRKHLDIESLRDELGAESLKPIAIDGEQYLFEVNVPSPRASFRAVVRANDQQFQIECLEAPPSLQGKSWRKIAKLIRATIELQVAEQLPFDEPKTEVGQQDGMLRLAWSEAYKHGGRSYTFNEDDYPVFDDVGRPKVPQVCIDFIVDTIERSAGTWYGKQGEARKRYLWFQELALKHFRLDPKLHHCPRDFQVELKFSSRYLQTQGFYTLQKLDQQIDSLHQKFALWYKKCGRHLE